MQQKWDIFLFINRRMRLSAWLKSSCQSIWSPGAKKWLASSAKPTRTRPTGANRCPALGTLTPESLWWDWLPAHMAPTAPGACSPATPAANFFMRLCTARGLPTKPNPASETTDWRYRTCLSPRCAAVCRQNKPLLKKLKCLRLQAEINLLTHAEGFVALGRWLLYPRAHASQRNTGPQTGLRA